MNSSEIRQNLCEYCILVKGFSGESDGDIKEYFQECKRSTHVVRTENFELSEQEWIVQFNNKNDRERYLREQVYKSDNNKLVTSPCELPCDIPEEWLSDLPTELTQINDDRNSPDTWHPVPSGSSSAEPTNIQNEQCGLYPNEQNDQQDPNPCQSSSAGAYQNTGPTWHQGMLPRPSGGPGTLPQDSRGPFYGYPAGPFPTHPGYMNQGLFYPGYGNVKPWKPGVQTKDGHRPPYETPHGPHYGTSHGPPLGPPYGPPLGPPHWPPHVSHQFLGQTPAGYWPRQGNMPGNGPSSQYQDFGPPPEYSEKELVKPNDNRNAGYNFDNQSIERPPIEGMDASEMEDEVCCDKQEPEEQEELMMDTEEVLSEKEENSTSKTANKLKVTNLPDGALEENLINFFENTRRQGGGDISIVELDEEERTAIITFEEDEAVERVLKKVPIKFEGRIVNVEAYTESQPHDDHDDSDTEAYHTPPQSDSEPEQSCTIEVTGIADDVSKETVEYYFESRKGGDCDVTDIVYVPKRKMYLITFEGEKGVSNALKKSHKIGSSKVSVKKHIPPKTYPNKVLISNIPENVSDDLLCNFMEAKTKGDVERVDFNEEERDKAVVTFVKNIELAKIQAACKKHLLQKSRLTVGLIPVSDSIIVRGFRDTTTKTTLECYFDNPRRSGVEGVKDCEMFSEEGYCLVYFENADNAVKAAGRKHTVDKCQLQVNVYHECLGVCTSDQEGGAQFKTPQPVIIKDLPPEKMKFLLVSESAKHDLDKALSHLYGKIDLGASKDEVKVISTVTKDTKNWASVVKTNWQKDVKKTVNDFFKNIMKEELSILQDAWKQVMEKVREINIPDPDKVVLKVEKSDNKLIIVGYNGPVQDLVQNLKVISDQVVKELEMQKQQVKEDVKVKHHQALILELTKFPENIKQKLSDIDIQINAKDCTVTFTGKASSVTEARLKMYEVTNDLVNCSLGERSYDFMQFLEKREVKRIVGRKMRDAKCIGVWDAQKNIVTMYSNTSDDLSKASDIFKDTIVETKVEIEKNQKHLVQSQKWNQFKKSVEDENNSNSLCTKVVINKKGELILYCTNTAEMANIRERVADFFLLNTENEVVLDINRAELRFLHENMKDEISKLENELRQRNISVAFKTDSVVVKSNKDGVQEAKNRVDALVKKIHKKTHSIDKPGLFELMRTDRGQNKLKQMGKSHGVVICTNDDLMAPGKGSRSVEFSTDGGQKVIVTTGDITALNVDVVINAANKELKHGGGLAKVLVEKGGRSIQNECDQYVRKHGQLEEGKIMSTSPGTLKCKFIIHAVGPVWQDGRNREEERLSDCVEAALTEAGLRKCSSIAFPALCTGIFGYPVREATRVIVQGVRDYFKRNMHSSIRTVYLCDIKSTTVDLFVKAGNKYFGQAKGEAVPQAPVSGGNRQGRFKSAPAKSPVHAPRMSTGSIKVKVVKGELAKMKVDVIVNTTSRDLRLDTGAVSKSLLYQGGRTLQDECRQRYPQGINYGDVAVTSGGNLHCHIVCHGSLDMWQHNGSNIKTLEDFMTECFRRTEGNSLKSIAFPALGTGNLGYPKDLVAKHMFMAIDSYSQRNPSTTIKEVLFVLYHKDFITIKAFEDEEARQSSGTPLSFAGRPQFSSDIDDKLYSVDLGNVTLRIYKGDITQANVDVIVNSSNTDLDLTLGEVSRAIKKMGGADLEKDLRKAKRAMRTDGIAVTKVHGRSSFTEVIHLDMKETSRKLKEKITQALTKTEELRKSKVAFPALGTSGSVTVEEAAKDLYNAVDEFQKSVWSIKEVHVIIFQADMVKPFMDTIEKCAAKHKSYWGKFKGLLGFGSDDDQKVVEEKQLPVRPKIPAADSAPVSIPVKFTIFSKNEREAKLMVNLLEKELDSEYITKNVIDKIIGELSPEQISTLNHIGVSEKVKVNINKSKMEITLTGIQENVFRAMTKANEVITRAQQMRFTNQKIQLVKDVVEWSFIDVCGGKKKLVQFPPDVNLILESAFKDLKNEVKFPDEQGHAYVVDLIGNQMFPEANKHDVCDVVRRSKLSATTFIQPPNWDKMDENETLKRVTLKQNSKEYKELITKFERSGAQGFNIVKVERIQNKTLYQQYQAKKKQMEDSNPPGTKNESLLWHGTDKVAEDSITKYGFNRSYCGKNAVAYGCGVYFAVNAGYSVSDTYSKPDASGLKRMYYCRVLTGESIAGNSSMRVPPIKKGHILYDSTTNNVANPSMFIIYHDSQAVAEYLITFKR